MLHTKFRGNRPAGSWEEDFWRVFYHIWAWRPSWSCDPDAANKLSFPLPKEAPHKIWLWLAKRFQRRRSLKLFTTDDGRRTDGRTPDHGYTISSPWAKTWQRWILLKLLHAVTLTSVYMVNQMSKWRIMSNQCQGLLSLFYQWFEYLCLYWPKVKISVELLQDHWSCGLLLYYRLFESRFVYMQSGG